MLLHLNDDVEVAGGATAATRLTLTAQSNLRPIINARWNFDMESLRAVESPLAAAGWALLLNDAPLAAALGARRLDRHLAEHRLTYGAHRATSAAAVALLGSRALRGATP